MDYKDRTCGSCTLCCKVLAVHGVPKPKRQWCQHIAKKKGCSIYDSRPQDCRDFICMYLISPVPEHWYPAHSKMILVSVPWIPRIEVQVDDDRLDAWRQAPYYDDLKAWARTAAANGGQVMVCLPDRSIIILPDMDVDVGRIAPDEAVRIDRIVGPDGQARAEIHRSRRD